MLVWSGGSSTTKDSGVTTENSFDTKGILNGENQLSKMDFLAWLLNIGFECRVRSQESSNSIYSR